MFDLVKENNGKLITELKIVCEVYGKKHKDVLRDIRNIISDLPSLEIEFIKTTYKDSTGRTLPTYYLTEKGFYILSASFKGKKAREFQSKFFDAFKALKDENKLLRSACSELFNELKSEPSGTELKSEPSKLMSADEIIDAFKALKDENKLLLNNNYLTKNTYCISDIVQKFENLEPHKAQLLLVGKELLEFRLNGIFPTEYYGTNNTIVSVLDYNRCRYYPRYTLKGVRLVEDILLEMGYKFKGLD